MEKKAKYNNLVDKEEIDELITLGVQRALCTKSISEVKTLDAGEIDQVSGGLLLVPIKLTLPPFFPWGIFPRDYPIVPAIDTSLKNVAVDVLNNPAVSNGF